MNLLLHGKNRVKNRSLWNMSPNKVENIKRTQELSMIEKGIAIGGNQMSNIIVWWKLYTERGMVNIQGDSSNK